MWVSAHFFIAPIGRSDMVPRPAKEATMINRKAGAEFWVLFPATGQRYPVQYTHTLDQYEVALPNGTIYGGIFLSDLKRALKADFNNVKVVMK
jgi:hypothetical protein